MKKIVVMPLLRMPSGHHQVAEALINMFEKQNKNVEIKKMDIMSYTSDVLEKIVTSMYLKWIRYTPGTYEQVYKRFINSHSDQSGLLKLYKKLFIKKMVLLLQEENPDLIICTHGFPSFLLNQLKLKSKLDIPVINVYTDFFVNDMWGKNGIDVHLVPNQEIRWELIHEFGVPERNIHVTGIPVHEEFLFTTKDQIRSSRKRILISGGNSGLGKISSLLEEFKKSKRFDYLVLCGNNQKLFNQISSWKLSHIKPIQYLTSRSEMNLLYEQVDAIITKPGGVTISEVIQKKLPIFIHSALPGQEEVNLTFLTNRGLVFEIDHEQPIEIQLLKKIANQKQLSICHKQMESYHKEFEVNEQGILVLIESLLDGKTYKHNSSLISHEYRIKQKGLSI
ncbi:galactosyldiacylglycerol synthase [Peribacillus cavernae]|uniref:Galactosyldiacylglycerol synthase n=1 Tax=Peribacillus cavernae TaxID=1674310 RepID=A0A3S0VRU2_9BACI|nr:galactosyldiacylglycerol synthase [Peribacillus cavernae]MDQ0218378.1 UDP-N-acetylglucosamine:LPS N-acetylglucosamine transferase [Peribacillus cavernae]RUQ31387.1 galactosyldiacylglycerol synthase [Peribacillus cavernae]